VKSIWYRILYYFYRALGASKVQAEWKVRSVLKAPKHVKERVVSEGARARDLRYNCVCGQLLIAGQDKVCHRCGRRQIMPHFIRKALRYVGLGSSSGAPANVFILFLVLGMFIVQLRYGSGGLMRPTGWLDHYELGATNKVFTLGAQPWRAFTYTLLHGGLMHIFFNAFVLMQIGPLIEKTFGSARFLFTWVAAGIVAAVLPELLFPGPVLPIGWTIGASGAVFGLIGLALIFGHRSGTAQGRYIRDEMIKWTLYTTVFGLLIGGVAHGAHFAGLATGIGLGLVIKPAHTSPSSRRLSPVLGGVALAIIFYSIGSLGLWVRAGAPVPTALPGQVQIGIYFELSDRHGSETYMSSQNRALFSAAKDLVRRKATLDEWGGFSGQLVSGLQQDDLVQRELLRRAVFNYLRENAPSVLEHFAKEN